MTKANRNATRAIRAALLTFGSAALLISLPAWAQPRDQTAQPQDSQGPAPRPGDQVAPPLLTPARLPGFPYAYQRRPSPRPDLTEPEGPVTTWDPLRFAVALESRTTWLFDSGAKRLAGKRAPTGGGLSVQGDIFRPDDKLAVRLDLSWITTSGSSIQDGTALTEKLEGNLFSLGASLRYQVFRWLAPFARLSGGMGWDKLTVADMHDRQRFEQGSAGAGVLLRTPGLRLWQGASSPTLAILGNLEGGYSVATSSDFTLQSSSLSSSAAPIPTSSVALGHMGRNVPYLRASLGLAF